MNEMLEYFLYKNASSSIVPYTKYLNQQSIYLSLYIYIYIPTMYMITSDLDVCGNWVGVQFSVAAA